MEYFVTKIKAKFAAQIIEKLENILGIMNQHLEGRGKLHHKGLVAGMLQMFKMTDRNPSQTQILPAPDLTLNKKYVLSNPEPFQQSKGSLFYISSTNMPDVAFEAGYLSKVLH